MAGAVNTGSRPWSPIAWLPVRVVGPCPRRALRSWRTGPEAHPMASSVDLPCCSPGPDVVCEESHIPHEGARVQEEALMSVRDREGQGSRNMETERTVCVFSVNPSHTSPRAVPWQTS